MARIGVFASAAIARWSDRDEPWPEGPRLDVGFPTIGG